MNHGRLIVLSVATCLIGACGVNPNSTQQGGSPPPAAPGANPSFAFIEANIFGPRCNQCHGPTLANAGLDVSTYAGVMASGFVKASQPLASTLYQVVASGTMPQTGGMLSGADIADIYTWILNGAPDN